MLGYYLRLDSLSLLLWGLEGYPSINHCLSVRGNDYTSISLCLKYALAFIPSSLSSFLYISGLLTYFGT